MADNGKVLIGLIVIVVAIWMLLSLDNATARYLGGIIVAIIGIFILAAGLKAKGRKKK